MMLSSDSAGEDNSHDGGIHVRVVGHTRRAIGVQSLDQCTHHWWLLLLEVHTDRSIATSERRALRVVGVTIHLVGEGNNALRDAVRE